MRPSPYTPRQDHPIALFRYRRPKSTPESVKQAQRDIQRYVDREVMLIMTLPEAISLIGLLQLTLRHPNLPPTQAKHAKTIAKTLEEGCAIAPALKRVIAFGWNPKYDYDPEEGI